MESPTEKKYDQNEELEGTPRLVGEDADNVDASGVDDDSTGMGDDDFLGRSNNRNSDK